MFRIGTLSACALIACATVASVRSAQPENATQSEPDRAKVLVQGLGDSSFQVRRESAQKLKELGLAARPALIAGAKDSDPEIRYRASRLLEQVEQLDHQQRLERFLKAPEQAPDDLLPGLKRFRKTVGTNPASLELFARMQRAEPKLFRRLDAGGKQFQTQFEQRCAELQYAYRDKTIRRRIPENVHALLFLAAEPELKTSDRTESLIYSFVNYKEVRASLTGDRKDPAVRKLIGAWVAKPSGWRKYFKLLLALRHNLPEGLKPALETVQGGTSNSQVQYGVLAIGKFGGKEYLPKLEELFSNQSVLSYSKSRGKTIYSCQVRDVALASALHLTGQDPKQYGFERLRKHPEYLFWPGTAGFKSEKDRKAAFRKWKQWKAANLESADSPRDATGAKSR